MTAVTEKAPPVLTSPKDPRESFAASRFPVYLACLVIAVVWLIPALGIHPSYEPRSRMG